MIKVKTILNNCIFDIISNNKFNRIFVYWSENLELEKLIFSLTSSPIIGGDVDFCNVFMSHFFATKNTTIEVFEESNFISCIFLFFILQSKHCILLLG